MVICFQNRCEESNQTMAIQLKNANILMQAECDKMGPCMYPNTDLIHQQVQGG